MDTLLVVLIIVLLIVIIDFRSSVTRKLNQMSRQIDDLNLWILRQQNVTKIPEKEPHIVPEPEIIRKKEPEVIIKQTIEKKPEKYVYTPPIKKEKQEKEPSKINWERFVGENLISKIGIVILVLGIAFSVKYAIDKDWIGTVGRVGVGILAGGILIGIAHYLRKNYASFSSVLVGGGLATLYFTIAFAFHEYQLISQTVAFLIMVLITAFSIILSVGYNRVELAILAILGGFASPIMVSKGGGNYVVLFSYIILLDVGMLVLSYLKKWNLIHIVSYVCTVLVFAGWFIIRTTSNETISYSGTFSFATVFYLLFFAMNIIPALKENEKIATSNISILLSNTFLYYSIGMITLHEFAPLLRGIFTISIGVFNFVFVYALYRKSNIDKNLLYLLIGLVLTFASLSAPVQLNGNYITLFWAAEAVLLLWLYQKSDIQLIKFTSIVVTFLTIISLSMDFHHIYMDYDSKSKSLNILLNQGFITGFIATISFLATYLLLRNEKNENFFWLLPTQHYKIFTLSLSVIFLYITFLLELNYQMQLFCNIQEGVQVVVGGYNFFFLLVLLLVSLRIQSQWLTNITFLLGLVGIISYFGFYHQQIFIVLRDKYLMGEISMGYFNFHYLSIALLLGLVWTMYHNIEVLNLSTKMLQRVGLWVSVLIGVFVLSAELDHFVMLNSYTKPLLNGALTPENYEIAFTNLKIEILKSSHRIGFPILWGACSFIMMIIGIKLNNRDLRILSLSLFSATLLKLFLIDVWQMSSAGKIAAFISLGILLLIISFLYQKLKKIIEE